MKYFLFVSVSVCLLLLTACQRQPGNNEAAVEQSSTESSTETIQISEAEVVAAINAAADWQLAHMTDFASYVPSLVHRTEEPRGWVQGTFYLGLVRWATETSNDAYFDFLRQHGDAQEWQLGPRIFHADDHVIAQFYLHLYEKDKREVQRLATQGTFEHILENRPDSSLDFEPRGKFRDQDYEHDCQKRWCWSDALFMSPPVWFQLSSITGDPRYADYAHKEFVDVTNYLFDQDDALYLRDSRFFDRRESNGAKIYWSRGNGWVYAGLTKIIDSLQLNDPRREYYIELFKRMSSSLINKQADNGYWPVSLAAGDIYDVPESSGTAFFVAGLAWGLNHGILTDDAYLQSVKRGWQALRGAQKDDGMLGYVQQIGYAPDKVSPDETQLYGTGAFLLAGVQMLALVKK